MARALMTAIGTGWPDGAVRLVSELRSLVSDGDSAAQEAVFAQAKAETARVLAELSAAPPALWVTYHNYYKAPDLLGPPVCAALGIPYVIVEASRARSRLTGPWARFAAAAEAASDAAQVIYYVVDLDLITLGRDKTPAQNLVHLRPFLPIETLPLPPEPVPGRILSVAMMRGRDKLDSYRIIAEVLGALRFRNWTYHIAGDGPARPEVGALMAPFGNRVRFLGRLDRDQLAAAYRGASVFLWPGFNEAYGLVYLEAQAAGVPVVAQDRDGVRDVVAPAGYPTPGEGAAPLAAMLDDLLRDDNLRARRSNAARDLVAARHLLGPARDTFWAAARPLTKGAT